MHFLISIIVFIVLLRVILRMLGLGGHRYRRHHGFFNRHNGYGYNNYGYDRPRGGGLFALLGLIALDRLFTRRW
jgi:hypothetical protein